MTWLEHVAMLMQSIALLIIAFVAVNTANSYFEFRKQFRATLERILRDVERLETILKRME